MWSAMTWVLHDFFPPTPFLKSGCKGRFKYEKDKGRTEMEEEMKGLGVGKESLKTHGIQKWSTMSRRMSFEM